MILEVRAVAPFYKNGFVVACERTREAVLIDPGDEVDELLGAVRDLDVDVQAVLLTHAHIDHITGVAAAKEAFDVPVYLHRDDLFLYDMAVQQGALFGFKVRQPPPVDVYLRPEPVPFRRLRGPRPPHAGPLPGRRLPADRQEGRGRAVTCSSATRCLPVRLAAPILPGGDYGVLMRSITEVLFPAWRRLDRAPRARAGHDDRPGARRRIRS